MMGNPVFVDTMNALGGNGVSMVFFQLLTALQTGVVDGAENNYPSYDTGSALSPRQILFLDRTSDDPGNPRVLEAHMGTTLFLGRPGI